MKQLTGLDSAFLYLETERTPMHVGGVAILDPETPVGPLTLDALRDLIRSRLHTSATFTQKLVDVPLNLGRPYWVDDPEFDLDAHVERTQLPEPGGMRELRALVEFEHARPLPRDRPLWYLLLVEGLEQVRGVPAGSLAIISKVHHAAIDGMSGVEMMTALFDAEPTPRELPAPPADAANLDSSDTRPSKLRLLREMGQSLIPGTKAFGGAVGDTLRGVVRSGATWAFERVEPPPFPFTAPRSILNGAVSKERAWDCVHLDFDRIRAVREATSSTVNDVVLAICAGALRRYLDEEGALPDEPLVAMCPISVRTEDQKGTMGNQVSAMLVSLATDESDAGERMERIMRSAYDSKLYNRAIGARTLTDAGNIVPFSVAGLAARLYTRMHLAERHRPVFNLVITNVPGPRIPLYVAGARLRANAGLAPIFDGMG
ncbi:MAG: wax ester/triacylglycerol synthase family O-acyltransferase, partial [Holophagales bacterium]|nr:wax ester/triacylglycerol synthase family O-acyltransferase [Holophagales bacterium]